LKASDSVYLILLEEKTLFFDRKSKEPFTDIVKPKYKLIGTVDKSLNIYIFYVTTSKKHSKKCFEIFPDDWEKLKKGYLRADVTYLNYKNTVIMHEAEFLEKAKSKIIFRVGALKDEVFQRLRAYIIDLQAIKHTFSPKLQETLEVDLEGIAESKLKQLGIAPK